MLLIGNQVRGEKLADLSPCCRQSRLVPSLGWHCTSTSLSAPAHGQSLHRAPHSGASINPSQLPPSCQSCRASHYPVGSDRRVCCSSVESAGFSSVISQTPQIHESNIPPRSPLETVQAVLLSICLDRYENLGYP